MPAVRALSAILCIVSLLICGCASTAKRTDELLLKDYRTMSDTELESYYFQLNDQIARVERQSRGTSIGIGFGSSSTHVGASTGVTRRTVADDLRDRRNEVRQELGRRGLRP